MPMTPEEARAERLRNEHPNLADSVEHGRLPENVGDFTEVAEQYPLQKQSEK